MPAPPAVTDTLGLHLSSDGIAAVRVDAAAGTAPTVIGLGADGPLAVCAVGRDDSGAVVVGAAAVGLDGTVVVDPLERAANGQIGALAAVINHVVGRAAAATGSAPRRLAVVVPDDWAAPQRDRIVEAGAAAGLAQTVTVPASAASASMSASDLAGGSSDTGEGALIALAGGAASAASLAAAPLVTREDLGETVGGKAPVVLPPVDPPTGPVSVFDEGEADEPAPARPAAEPVAAAPTTQVVPAVPVPAAAGPGSAIPAPEALRYEPPARRFSGALIALVVVVGLIGAVVLALVAFGGDDGGDTATDTDPTTTLATTTTLDATTTAPPDTTTTADPDQTATTVDPTETTTTTTSTTTTEAPSTTTTPVPVGSPGDVTLSETGLRLTGGELVLFDQSESTVFAALVDVLGEPDADTGLEEAPFCSGERSRFVTWGDLEVVFTEDELDSGESRFTQWYAAGHDDPEGLVTLSGVGVGATVGFLEVTLGSSLQLVAAVPDEPAGLFAATNQGSGGILNGTTSTRDPEGLVTGLWAGDSCTRIFT